MTMSNDREQGQAGRYPVIVDEQLEKYSSALTLSDMEIFVFPELMYALVLANIMSPIIWRWRELSCFSKLKGKSPQQKLMRMRQFIMDEYEFNLDLETWGLTRQQRELERFGRFIDPQEIARSNALFGYQGDKYYFDVGIRRHFGLDKYEGDTIPYWKTETVEAMDAFRFKKGYEKKAGECVSLAALYVAAAFIVCEIPLSDIYMMLTPLHSQNFIDINDGVLTNNRRVVTKTMWFNGTAITLKAQRALQNEQVTIVTHHTGYIHCLYKQATIDRQVYERFGIKLRSFLHASVNQLILANFLRANRDYQQYFQFCRRYRGEDRFIKAEVLFCYEHSSKFRVGDESFKKLLSEVCAEDYSVYCYEERVCCEQLQRFIDSHKINLQDKDDRGRLRTFMTPFMKDEALAGRFVDELAGFVHIDPRLPDADKDYVANTAIDIEPAQGREEIVDYLKSIRADNITADLAFYAYRDMRCCSWEPFVKAALQRNPVSISMCEDMSTDTVYEWLVRMANESIYDSGRLAQPDEVANFNRGDGLEKAFLLANVIKSRNPDCKMTLNATPDKAVLEAGGQGKYVFDSAKGLSQTLQILDFRIV